MSGTLFLPQGLPSHIGPGSMIDGKYRLEQQIGRGSMGTVFSASHVTLGQRVAIKLISLEHSQSPEARRRFATEAKAAAQLRSRHVVQVYDDGETAEGNPYIVLELLEGETVEQRVERERDISLIDATRIVSHVARALARAHAHGIVHRDLKPANIFLVRSEDEEVGWIAKVLDFGIAKLDSATENRTTQAGTVLGTPLFMSPEQVRGASFVDHRADLYSLGMCLYYMLTGELAFYSPNYSDILVAICTQPLPAIRAKAPWVPEAVEHWFQRACAREPLQRFQSADEMAEALRAAAGVPALSKHQSVPDERIAPETLMGFNTPPELRKDGGALGRTLQLPQETPAPASTTSPGFGSPHGGAAPPPATFSPTTELAASGDFTLPKRSLKPFVVAAVFTALTLATVAVTVLALREPREPPRPAVAASPAVEPPAPSAVAPVVTLPAPTAAIVSPSVLSSVAAESPPVPPSPAAPPPRAPTSRAPAASPPPAKKPPPKTAGSDLGF